MRTQASETKVWETSLRSAAQAGVNKNEEPGGGGGHNSGQPYRIPHLISRRAAQVRGRPVRAARGGGVPRGAVARVRRALGARPRHPDDHR
eukprot:324137-Prorocentrum_minimum.AAC.1